MKRLLLRSSRQDRSGFALLEVIISLLAGSCLLSVLLTGLLTLHRALLPPRIMDEGEALPVAPSAVPLPAALRLQELFLSRLEGATAVYVLGGTHPGLTDTDAALVATAPLATDGLPELGDLRAGLPTDSSSFDVLYREALGPRRSNASSEDFSVLVFGPREGRPSVLCHLQVSGQALRSQGEGRGLWRRNVVLRDVEAGRIRYCFAERRRPNTEIGATHSWYRFGSAVDAREEGPARIVLPDPLQFAGEAGVGGSAGSRFIHFLPVSP